MLANNIRDDDDDDNGGGVGDDEYIPGQTHISKNISLTNTHSHLSLIYNYTKKVHKY